MFVNIDVFVCVSVRCAWSHLTLMMSASSHVPVAIR